MKKSGLILCMLAIGLAAGAQVKTNFKKVAPLPNTNTPKDATVSGYAANIVAGDLTLVKSIQKSGEGAEYTTTYAVTKRADNTFNGGKPLTVTLSQGGFDALFSQAPLSAKRSQMSKYVSSHNLSLSDEKGWVAALRYYNSTI